MNKDYKNIQHELSKGLKESDKIKIPWGKGILSLELLAAIYSVLLSFGSYYEEISIFGLRLEPDFLEMFEDGWFFLALYIFAGFNILISLLVLALGISVSAINTSLKLKAESLNNTYRTAIMTEEMLNMLKSKYPEHFEADTANNEPNIETASIQKKEEISASAQPYASNFTTCPCCDTKQQKDRKFCLICGNELKKD